MKGSPQVVVAEVRWGVSEPAARDVLYRLLFSPQAAPVPGDLSPRTGASCDSRRTPGGAE